MNININTDNWTKPQTFLVGMLAGMLFLLGVFSVVHQVMSRGGEWDHMKGDRYGNDNYRNDTRGDLPRGVQPVPGVTDEGTEAGRMMSPSSKPMTALPSLSRKGRSDM